MGITQENQSHIIAVSPFQKTGRVGARGGFPSPVYLHTRRGSNAGRTKHGARVLYAARNIEKIRHLGCAKRTQVSDRRTKNQNIGLSIYSITYLLLSVNQKATIPAFIFRFFRLSPCRGKTYSVQSLSLWKRCPGASTTPRGRAFLHPFHGTYAVGLREVIGAARRVEPQSRPTKRWDISRVSWVRRETKVGGAASKEKGCLTKPWGSLFYGR